MVDLWGVGLFGDVDYGVGDLRWVLCWLVVSGYDCVCFGASV